MKAKQLEVILNKHHKFLNAGKTDRPDNGSRDILVMALSGKPLKLLPVGKIVANLRNRLVVDRYTESLKFDQIFETPKDGAVGAWRAAEAERQTRVKAYRKKVDPILRKAELHEDSDADEVMDAIVEAAKEHGLYV